MLVELVVPLIGVPGIEPLPLGDGVMLFKKMFVGWWVVERAKLLSIGGGDGSSSSRRDPETKHGNQFIWPRLGCSARNRTHPNFECLFVGASEA
jgi:hypothetical protein